MKSLRFVSLAWNATSDSLPRNSSYRSQTHCERFRSASVDCEPPLRCAVRTKWCSALTVRCRTGSKSMCGSSKTCFRARLSANRCSGRQATEYSAWAYSLPISSPLNLSSPFACADRSSAISEQFVAIKESSRSRSSPRRERVFITRGGSQVSFDTCQKG
jgi:hypothetical protein